MREVPDNAIGFEKNKIPLVALINGKGIEGSFFLGSGEIDTEPYYFYYTQESDGGKTLNKIDAGMVRVYEDDRKDAYIAEVWFKNKDILDDDVDVFLRYAIHVPKGTIKEVIDLDIRNLK